MQEKDGCVSQAAKQGLPDIFIQLPGGIGPVELAVLSSKLGGGGAGKREGFLEDDKWEAPPFLSTPFPKENIAAL